MIFSANMLDVNKIIIIENYIVWNSEKKNLYFTHINIPNWNKLNWMKTKLQIYFCFSLQIYQIKYFSELQGTQDCH